MNEKLLQVCGDKIEVLYQRRRRVPADAAWQRLREELTLISGTEAEQRFLVAAEIATICRRNSWPVWTVGSGPSSIVLFLLELSQADPLEHGLIFERFFYPTVGQTAGLTLTTLERYVEPLKKLLAKTDATAWVTVNTASVPEAIPFLVEEDLRRQGKAPDWGREPTDWPIIWEIFDSSSADRFCEPDVYQFHLVDVFEARQAWQPGSPVQLAAITAIAL